MPIIVRRMREEDILQAVEIEKIAFSRPWSKSVFKATLLLPYAAYYVAVEEETGRVVGLCGVKKIFEEGDISNVAVRPEYRKKGIARKMLDLLMREARQDGVREFTLEVRAGNTAAVTLYESLGFLTEGIRPRFYDHPVEDCRIMWLREKQEENI